MSAASPLPAPLRRAPTAALPFAGFATARPWPPTGLTTARWAAQVPLVVVAFGQLHLSQEHVDIAALFGLTRHPDSDSHPHAISWRGDLYLEDGHHRVVRAALQGKTCMQMRVFRVSGQTPDQTADGGPT